MRNASMAFLPARVYCRTILAFCDKDIFLEDYTSNSQKIAFA